MSGIVDSKWSDRAPSTLFHYTSLESLALILSNRTIRLNPLHKMDDLQEARARDVPGFARYVFVSCWTDDAMESIPMWNMYAGLDKGVRIEMRVDPFLRYSYNEERMSAISGFPVENIDFNGEMKTFLPAEDMREFYSPAFLEGAGILKKVEYVSDVNLLEPKIATFEESQLAINSGLLGGYKNKYWEFQSEWRYVLNFCPFDVFGDVSTSEQRFGMAVGAMMDLSEPPVLDYYDLHLAEDAVREMKVMLSPKMSPGNRLLAEALLKHHGLEGCLVESKLRGLI